MAARESSAMVREESHLDDMRAAIRGDFERLERRRGAQDLMHVVHPSEPLPEFDDDEDVGPAESPRRPWLSRLLGR